MKNFRSRVATLLFALGFCLIGCSLMATMSNAGPEVQNGYECGTQPIDSSPPTCYHAGSPTGPCQGSCSVTTTNSPWCNPDVPKGPTKCALNPKDKSVQAQDYNGYCTYGNSPMSCMCLKGTTKGAPYLTAGFVCTTSN